MSKENDECVYLDVHSKNSVVGFGVCGLSDDGVSAHDRSTSDRPLHVALT